MHEFRKLKVYQRALIFTKGVRKVTKQFPRDELFGLISQFRKPSYSICLNIAEGAGRRTEKDFSRFLDNAIGSCYECISCMDIALVNEMVSESELKELYREADAIAAMLVGLQRSLR